jgi:hypothetical protein
MGSGPVNELEIDDVEFTSLAVLSSSGQSDQVRIEQDLGRAGSTEFLGSLSVQMGPGGTIGLGTNNAASYTQSSAPVSIKGSKPRLIATVTQVRVDFAIPPVLKNAEFVLV